MSTTACLPQDKHNLCREDSFQLLQEQLKEGMVSRKQLLKTQQAIVVLYARHVLASLLSHWPCPPHPLISTSFLGNMDILQFFSLLDLLVKPLSRMTCSNVSSHGNSDHSCCHSVSTPHQLLGALVNRTEPTQLVSLAVTASECMRKVSVGMEKKQFHHTAEDSHEEVSSATILLALSAYCYAGATSLLWHFHREKLLLLMPPVCPSYCELLWESLLCFTSEWLFPSPLLQSPDKG